MNSKQLKPCPYKPPDSANAGNAVQRDQTTTHQKMNASPMLGTREPPTEPGWYWIHIHNAYGESFTPRIARIRSNSPIDRHPEEILTVHEFSRVCSGLSLETFVGEYKHCRPIRWLKIEEPEIPK